FSVCGTISNVVIRSPVLMCAPAGSNCRYVAFAAFASTGARHPDGSVRLPALHGCRVDGSWATADARNVGSPTASTTNKAPSPTRTAPRKRRILPSSHKTMLGLSHRAGRSLVSAEGYSVVNQDARPGSEMSENFPRSMSLRLPALDALRAIGSIAVVATHTAFLTGASFQGVWGGILT